MTRISKENQVWPSSNCYLLQIQKGKLPGYLVRASLSGSNCSSLQGICIEHFQPQTGGVQRRERWSRERILSGPGTPYSRGNELKLVSWVNSRWEIKDILYIFLETLWTQFASGLMNYSSCSNRKFALESTKYHWVFKWSNLRFLTKWPERDKPRGLGQNFN